jgi:hypothetical protein
MEGRRVGSASGLVRRLEGSGGDRGGERDSGLGIAVCKNRSQVVWAVLRREHTRKATDIRDRTGTSFQTECPPQGHPVELTPPAFRPACRKMTQTWTKELMLLLSRSNTVWRVNRVL